MDPTEAESALVEDIARFEHDPLGFVLYAFPWGEGELASSSGPRKWQKERLESIGDRLRSGYTDDPMRFVGEVIQDAVASGHGIGKSALVAWLVLWAMTTREECRGVVTANTDGQLRTKTWPEVAKWHRMSITRNWFEWTATSLSSRDQKRHKTWRIDAIPWSEVRPEAFQGLHNLGKRLLVIFDEASAIPDKIWEVTEGAMTDENTEIIWCVFGNPTRSTGRFRKCFQGHRHRWITSNIDSRSVEGTNKAHLQKWVDDYGEDSDFVKVRVRGQFPNASFRQFISDVDVDLAIGRHLKPGQFNFAPTILTCDPAWEGDDELVIGLRQGLAFFVMEVIPKNDNDIAIANKLAIYEDECDADAVFIDAGYGTGIVSGGRTMNRDHWMLVWFGGKSSDTGCFRKRDEMWKLMRDWLKDGGSIPNDDVLRADLTGPEQIPTFDGKVRLESKPDMKRRGCPSPNRADALALSFAYPVVKKRRGMLHKKSGKGMAVTTRNHDPYARK